MLYESKKKLQVLEKSTEWICFYGFLHISSKTGESHYLELEISDPFCSNLVYVMVLPTKMYTHTYILLDIRQIKYEAYDLYKCARPRHSHLQLSFLLT